ncbi:translationally-controlled tumor protein-like [Scyliorhinus canicula]|uniref:translationally-controlled tumor protein-like n=1 Tax=Scyliorhinus canicula TaxID=7830 RepID=UPI0018F40C8D|nr:translationally-controlled tumor protein-like [Scyliorhinus canicula]
MAAGPSPVAGVYKCIISGDKMFADIYRIKEGAKDITFKVEGKIIPRTEGSIDEFLISGNASQECCGGQAESQLSIVLNRNLKEVSFAKSTHRNYIKDFMKYLKIRIEERNPDNTQAANAEILSNFVNYHFFLGESMNHDGMVGLLNYHEDIVPYIVFFKDD